MRTLSLPATGSLLSLLIVTTLALSACGDDGGSDESSNSGTTSTNSGTTSTNSGTTSTNGSTTGTTSTNGGTTSTNGGTTSTNGGTTSTNSGTTSTNGGTTSTNSGTGGVILRENVEEAEIGNTLADLDAIPLIDLGDTNYDAIVGNIGDTWTAPDGVVIGDVDWYAFQAPPRSTVTFTVEPATAGGPYRPLVYTHDSFKFITLGYDEAVATTDLIYPYVAGTIGMYLFVSDITNEENFETGGPYVGGPGHDYRITWDITPFAPVELGEGLTPGMSVSAPAVPLEEGEMRIYRFTTSGEGVPEVTFQASGSDEWFPEILPLTTVGGQAVYEVVACEGELSRTIGWEEPELVEVLDNGDKEYLVALFDCNGKGGADYTFTLDVSVD